MAGFGTARNDNPTLELQFRPDSDPRVEVVYFDGARGHESTLTRRPYADRPYHVIVMPELTKFTS